MSVRWIGIMVWILLIGLLANSIVSGTDQFSGKQSDLNRISQYSKVTSQQTFGPFEVPGAVVGYWDSFWNIMTNQSSITPAGSQWALLGDIFFVIPLTIFVFGIVLLFFSLFKAALT